MVRVFFSYKMMKDYIIVGSGLAGIAIAETLLQHNKSFVVFENQSQNSSSIAGGLYNPVILKRFSQVWNANQQLELANSFYAAIEKKLEFQFDFKIPIYRKFFSIEEQNNWFTASDKPLLSNYLGSEIETLNNQAVASNFKFGKVHHTGFLDTKKLKEAYTHFLLSNSMYIEETFDYSKIHIENNYIQYNNIRAKQLVFAEGFGLHSNPYFNNLPLDGTKGELLIIKSENLNLKETL